MSLAEIAKEQKLDNMLQNIGGSTDLGHLVADALGTKIRIAIGNDNCEELLGTICPEYTKTENRPVTINIGTNVIGNR